MQGRDLLVQWNTWLTVFCTGKSLSEALIFVSTNPQYDNRLFIELQVQYMKICKLRTWLEHVEQSVKTKKQTICVHNMFYPCYPHVLSLQFTCTELVIQ